MSYKAKARVKVVTEAGNGIWPRLRDYKEDYC